jgi:hypothetical protein
MHCTGKHYNVKTGQSTMQQCLSQDIMRHPSTKTLPFQSKDEETTQNLKNVMSLTKHMSFT